MSLYKSHFNENSILVVTGFLGALLFQITAYKYIWGIELLSRITNITILVSFGFYFFYNILNSKIYTRYFYLYLFPGLLVFLGMAVNLLLSSMLNFNVLNQVGLLLPWVTYLSMPWLVKFGRIEPSLLWRYFHNFMVIVVLLGIVEYYLVNFGMIEFRHIDTSGGPFMAGAFSMLYALDDGELHYRFYGGFMEPGTLAMFLLPAMTYALFWRRYVALAVFSVGIFLSDSLGGYIGIVMMLSLYFLDLVKENLISKLIFILCLVILAPIFYGYFFDSYEKKGNSAEVREESIVNAIENIPDIVLNYPLGMMRAEGTEKMQENRLYSGATFTPGNALIGGGLISFLGYLAVLLVSLVYALVSIFQKNTSINDRIVAISIICLFPFIFQRTAIWDFSLFALLFSPYILSWLHPRLNGLDHGFSNRAGCRHGG